MKFILVPLLFCASYLSAIESNILVNCSFNSDGIGGELNWSRRSMTESSIECLSCRGPSGKEAFRLQFKNTEYLSQGGIKLLAGEIYEAKVFLRTKRMKGKARFYCCDKGWSRDVKSPTFPGDTQGKWEEFRWQFSPFKSNGEYSFIIGGQTGEEGSLEISDLTLLPVSPRAQSHTKKAECAKRMYARIVPIDPLLADIDPNNAKVTFYYPGDLLPNAEAHELVASIGNVKASAKIAKDGKATVSFGKLLESCKRNFTLDVGVVRMTDGVKIASNSYPVTLNPQVPTGPQGRKLNNFVTELYRSENVPSRVRFFNPRRGWVYIGFDCEDEKAKVFLGNGTSPIVRHRKGELSETMRKLEAGWHDLRIEPPAQAAVFSVRALKRIVHVSPSFDMKKSDLLEWRLRHDFTKRYAFKFFNVASFYRRKRTPAWIAKENAALEERGIEIESMAGFDSSDPDRGNPARIKGRFFYADGWPQGFPLTIDENGVSSPRPWRVNLSETIWQVCDHCQWVNGMYADAVHSVYTDPTTQTSEISAIVNSGRGNGMLYPEAYCTVLKDARTAHSWEEQLLRYRQSVIDFVPAAVDSIVYYFGTFYEPGHYTDWSQPEGDMKRLLSDYIWRIATDPAFGNPGGIAAGYFGYTDDDVARWLCRLVRYYAVDGGRENLGEKYGFAFLTGHIKNPDFAEGLAQWKVKEGGKGGIQALTVPGYGSNRGQNRKKAPRGTGDSVALFTRKSSPNVISQKLVGLMPGKYYHVHFIAADEADVKRPDHSHFIKPEEMDSRPSGYVTNGTFMAKAMIGDGGIEVPELTGLHIPFVRRKNWKEVLFNQYRVVFKATKNEAMLFITDWDSPDNPGGDIGSRIYVNFVNVREYYVEDEEEFKWLKSRRRDNDFVSKD